MAREYTTQTSSKNEKKNNYFDTAVARNIVRKHCGNFPAIYILLLLLLERFAQFKPPPPLRAVQITRISKKNYLLKVPDFQSSAEDRRENFSRFFFTPRPEKCFPIRLVKPITSDLHPRIWKSAVVPTEVSLLFLQTRF